MVDMICLELVLAFVIVAALAAVATTGASQTVKGIASKTINGSLTLPWSRWALTAWCFFWPPA